MQPRFAAALSQHPDLAHSVGEVVGQVLDAIGPGPDVAIVSVTPALAPKFAEVVAAVEALVSPGMLLGLVSPALIGNGQRARGAPAVALWAGWPGQVQPVRLAGVPGADGNFAEHLERPHQTIVLIAHGASMRVDSLMAAVRTPAVSHLSEPLAQVVGGTVGSDQADASWASVDSRPALYLDGQAYSDGAVGFAVPNEATEVAVAHGCRALGEPLIVTATVDGAPSELAGVPARLRLLELLDGENDDALPSQVRAALQLGVVIDESADVFGAGDFVMRPVRHVDPTHNAVGIDHAVSVGQTVQFHVPDTGLAARRLRNSITSPLAAGGLLFSSAWHGQHGAESHDSDASVALDRLGSSALGGFEAALQLAPIQRTNYVHAYSSTAVLFK